MRYYLYVIILELKNNGLEISFENVMRDVVSRDKRDQERNASPLIIADDAYEIDTSSLSANDAVGVAIDHINEKFKNL